MTTKTRFAPSPTGYLHLGNVRTALFNALLAGKEQGVFLLRIEDTDLARSCPEYETALQEDLRWLGLTWQEGPVVGGKAAPYAQSQRASIYHHYYQSLEQQHLSYPCFCSESQLAMVRKSQRQAGQPPRYPGTCARLTSSEIGARLAAGAVPALRFRVPPGRSVVFTDLVRGVQHFATDDIGDFIIRRADGSAAFFFCNAIDDALMGVTTVLRGEDHLSNTPRQILILEALGLPVPQYGHIAMIVDQEGGPLSKRAGSLGIATLRDQGFLPGAINNYLARLGHSYESHDYMTWQELAANFQLEHLGHAPARHDENQLLYWQKQAFQSVTEEDLWQQIPDSVKSLIPEAERSQFFRIIRPNAAFVKEVVSWVETLFTDHRHYDLEAEDLLRKTDDKLLQDALTTIDTVELSQWVAETGKISGCKGKQLFMPLRAAVTGRLHGPEFAPLLMWMGRERVRRRLTDSLALALPAGGQ